MKNFHILMADDDAEDCLLVKDALAAAELPHALSTVANGEELLDYLRRSGDYKEAARADLVLLDFNMPRMDGREVLSILKGDPQLRRIPVVVLTTSMSEDDVLYAYDAGASAYLAKPASFEVWVELVRALSVYWFEFVSLPSRV